MAGRIQANALNLNGYIRTIFLLTKLTSAQPTKPIYSILLGNLNGILVAYFLSHNARAAFYSFTMEAIDLKL